MKHKWIARTWTTVVVALIAVGVGVAPANAATGPGGHVITCTVSLDNPHKSGHVNGTISAQGRVSCTSMVREIYIRTTLTNVTRATSASQTFDRFNVSSGSSVGAKSCAEGGATFQSKADVVVHFPAGYTPTPQIANKASNYISVPPCGVTRVAGTEQLADTSSDNYGTTEWTITATKP